jgi:uncharacterized protein (DUF3084 family)
MRLTKGLKEKKDKLDVRKRDLDDREVELVVDTVITAAQSIENEFEREEITEAFGEIALSKQDVKTREADVDGKLGVLDKKLQKLEVREGKLDDRESELNSLEKNLGEMKETLDGRDTELGNLERQLGTREKDVKDRETTIGSRENVLRDEGRSEVITAVSSEVEAETSIATKDELVESVKVLRESVVTAKEEGITSGRSEAFQEVAKTISPKHGEDKTQEQVLEKVAAINSDSKFLAELKKALIPLLDKISSTTEKLPDWLKNGAKKIQAMLTGQSASSPGSGSMVDTQKD